MFEGWCASEALWSAVSVEVGDGDPCGSKDARVIDVLETMEVPENGHIGIRASLPKKVAGSVAQLKCTYTNVHSMGNKQEELEAIVQWENYDIVAITETSFPELEDRDREKNEAPIIQGEMLSNLLHYLHTHKSMGPDGIHPRVLRELAEVFSKLLSIMYQQSWLTGEVLVDWKLANVMPIYRKGQEDPGNYKPVSLTSVLGKVMEQTLLNTITWHVQDNHVIRPSQHGFMKGRSCLTDLISFYDKVTH
ncbi:mitochondrial enolase superfamily member 1 [Grus japonensis]|uniref:Mitochondrial enolase superfamily member 1 n=1 Tax=Grus japonensis TaxID=30415 RepID=A0ABC9WFI3_GRUJA